VKSVSADASASYAAEVARLLWPEPWEAPYVTRSRHRPGQPHRDAYLFPSERRPRLLVPADVPGSSTMLRRLGPGRSGITAPVRSLLERSVHSRAFAIARWPMLRVPGSDPGADSIENHLAQYFETPVRVGVLLGTRRVNQKPVLQVFDLDGRLQGYAKVGHNDLTAALVRREAAALASIGAALPRWFRVPRLIHHGRWAGLEILVTAPLVAGRGQQGVSRVARVNAMLEVAGLEGVSTASLIESGFWTRLRHTAASFSAEAEGGRLERLVDAIERRHGEDTLHLGSWHGDWSRWNMNMRGGIVQIWDWERYEGPVPRGFDGVHFAAQAVRAQVVRSSHGDLHRQEQTFLQAVPPSLHELGVAADQHDLTLRLYLLAISVRYVDTLTHSATPALHRRTEWTLSLLERLMGQPAPRPWTGPA
jgi:hypothetical protein